MRKQSPETQIRHLKREVKEQSGRIRSILVELDERRRIGAMLSNICWNGKQRKDIPKDFQDSMAVSQIAWDGIKTGVRRS